MSVVQGGEVEQPRFDDDLASLIASPICKTEHIEALLAAAQDRGAKVNKTAKDKETLVNENLRRAVATGDVSLSDVHAMLADSEENDSQYHYFYRVTDIDAFGELSDMNAVGGKLFDNTSGTVPHFPNFKAKPKYEEWGDFREEPSPRGAQGWLLKLYWGDDRWVIDPEQSSVSDTKRTKVWVPQYSREVWLVRWLPRNQLLELCLPRLGNGEDQAKAFESLWKHVTKIVKPDAIEEFTLDAAATTIVRDLESFKHEVRLGGAAKMMSPDGGSTTMLPRSSQHGLLDSEDRREAIKNFEACHELGMFWLPTTSSDAIKSEIKVVTGHWGARNSVLFTAKNSGKSVRHVTQRLIELELQGRARKADRRKDSGVDPT